jgi:hypothetical protein
MSRATSNCRCGGPCFYCGDDLPGPHDHDHSPIPWRHGGRETVPSCRRCHKLKDYRDLLDWPPAALQSAADGMHGSARILVVLLASARATPDVDTAIDRDEALRALDDCSTVEAKIFLARIIAFALDEARRRRERGDVE